MATLDKRLQELEKATSPAVRFTMIVCKIIDVGRLGEEGTRCAFGDREWRRAHDESEEQFLGRVQAQIESPNRLPRVLLYSS